MILGAVVMWCLVLMVVSKPDGPAGMARIKYGSNVLTVRLNEDQTHTFRSDSSGYNTVTVRDGEIAVTEADCPDQYCVRQGFVNHGRAIVCLPNKLIISFMGEQEIDGQIG